MIWKIGVGRPLVYLDLVQMKSVGWEHGCWSWRQDCMRWQRIMSSTTALDREMLRRGLWDGENVKIRGVCEAEKGVSVATVCVCNHSACCLLNLHPSSSALRTHSGWRWCGSVWVEHSYLFVCLLVYQASYKKMGYGSIMGSPWSKKITSKLCSLIRFYEKFTVRTVDLKRPMTPDVSSKGAFTLLTTLLLRFSINCSSPRKETDIRIMAKITRCHILWRCVTWHDTRASTNQAGNYHQENHNRNHNHSSPNWLTFCRLGTTLGANCCELVWV